MSRPLAIPLVISRSCCSETPPAGRADQRLSRRSWRRGQRQRSKELNRFSPNDECVLPEASFQCVPVLAPPLCIDGGRHYFQHDDFIAPRVIMLVLPKASSWSASERRESSEAPGKFSFSFGKKLPLKLLASVVEERQQNLDQEHAWAFSSVRSCSSAQPYPCVLRAPRQNVMFLTREPVLQDETSA